MSIVSPYFQKMNVVFKWIAFLFCIREDLGSISDPETNYPELSVCGVPHLSKPLFANHVLTEYH